MSNQIGAGGFAEFVIGDSSGLVLGLPAIFFHPNEIQNLKFTLSGILQTYGTSRGSIFSNFGVRIGAGYDLKFKELLITPSISLDWGGHTKALIFGIYGGIKF
jgi:hypothetical protein